MRVCVCVCVCLTSISALSLVNTEGRRVHTMRAQHTRDTGMELWNPRHCLSAGAFIKYRIIRVYIFHSCIINDTVRCPGRLETLSDTMSIAYLRPRTVERLELFITTAGNVRRRKQTKKTVMRPYLQYYCCCSGRCNK